MYPALIRDVGNDLMKRPEGNHSVPVDMPILVDAILKALEEAGVRWAILRNAEGLPYFVHYDIDLLVASGHLRKAEKVVVGCAEAYGWQLLACLDKYRYRCLILAKPGDEREYLPIDLVSDCLYRAWSITDANFGLSMRVQSSKGVWVVPQGFEAATTVLKELLPHGRLRGVLREETKIKIARGAREDSGTFLRATTHVLGIDLAGVLLKYCQSEDWKGLSDIATRLRARTCSLAPRMWPRLLAYVWKTVRHYWRPPLNVFVAILGPDGSGKTTIANELCRRMYKHPFKLCKHVATNFGVLPQLKELRAAVGLLVRKQVALPRTGIAEAHDSATQLQVLPVWRSMIYILWYGLDMWLGRFMLRRWRGLGGLIVFARYYDDYYYQYAHKRTPRWFISLIGAMAPKPDLILYIDRDAEEIHKGKSELTPDEIERQQKIIKALLRYRRNAVIIDGRKGVEDTVQQVMSYVESYLGLSQVSSR